MILWFCDSHPCLHTIFCSSLKISRTSAKLHSSVWKYEHFHWSLMTNFERDFPLLKEKKCGILPNHLIYNLILMSFPLGKLEEECFLLWKRSKPLLCKMIRYAVAVTKTSFKTVLIYLGDTEVHMNGHKNFGVLLLNSDTGGETLESYLVINVKVFLGFYLNLNF